MAEQAIEVAMPIVTAPGHDPGRVTEEDGAVDQLPSDAR